MTIPDGRAVPFAFHGLLLAPSSIVLWSSSILRSVLLSKRGAPLPLLSSGGTGGGPCHWACRRPPLYKSVGPLSQSKLRLPPR